MKASFKSKGVKPIPTPTEVRAWLNRDKPEAPARNSYYSAAVGNTGSDSFWLKTEKREAFEGGHVIPHSVWDKTDPDVEESDHYDNLVPMSRTLNVEGWAGREEWMREKTSKLGKNQVLELGIDVTRDDFLEIPVGNLAKYFGLTLDIGATASNKIKLYNWLPRSLKLRYSRTNQKTAKIESEDEFSSDAEQLHDTFSEIDTMEDLRDALRQSQFNTRITERLWDELEGY